jgi:hypothetical protein
MKGEVGVTESTLTRLSEVSSGTWWLLTFDRKAPVRICTVTPASLIESFHDFSQFFLAFNGTLPQLGKHRFLHHVF